MLKNYIKIAFRNLFRKKLYSFLNITGLAIGFACSFLLLFYIQDELSFDRFHEKATASSGWRRTCPPRNVRCSRPPPPTP